MSTPSRAALLNKLHKVLKRTYKHTPTKGDQPLLESMLFGCCLENARQDLALECFTKLRESFFDWNEIRVSTVKELAEIVTALPQSCEAAARVKGVLQSVFEADYSFELEHLKKQNIGVAVKRLQKLQGATAFNVAYVTQSSLGGHAIPLDKGALGVLFVLGVINESEAHSGTVPGLERAIPKSKGQEFGALLHELGAEFFANPFAPALRDRLLSIAPDAKERFPKRASKKSPAETPAPPEPVKSAAGRKKKDGKRETAKESAAAKKQKTIGKHVVKGGSPQKKKAASADKKTPARTLARRKPR